MNEKGLVVIVWVFWLGLIFYFSSLPSLTIVDQLDWDLVVRKLGHLMIFLVLFLISCLLAREFRIKKFLLWAVFFSISYAICDEFHQTFTVGRVGVWWDVLIDSLGVLIGYLFATHYRLGRDIFGRS